MPYDGDIVLDSDGYSVVENGQLEITPSSFEFVLRSLRYGQGSWQLHPSIGLGLDQYIGEPNNEALRERIQSDVRSYFEGVGVLADVTVMPVDIHEISCAISLPVEEITVAFTFNVDSGVFVFTDYNREEQEQKIIDASRTINKYLQRRI